MSEKVAFIFDTNFIVKVKELDKVIEKLGDGYNVYITQVSIDERISQECLVKKTLYDNIYKIKTDYKEIATIKIKTDYSVIQDKIRNKMQVKYQRTFGSNIIQYQVDKNNFDIILKRAFNKCPPFSTFDSDKGFKDTLLWISLMDYFKKNGENKIIFITDDKGFLNTSNDLCKEFYESTKKSIEIKGNNFYNELTKENIESKLIISTPLPNFRIMSEKIRDVISALCYGEYDGNDFWGNLQWTRTFTIQTKVTVEDIENLFNNLESVIEKNIFETSLPANNVFCFTNIKNIFPIPMYTIRDALSLYEEICSNFNNYLPQFYNAAMNIFNDNYTENSPLTFSDSDDEIPF